MSPKTAVVLLNLGAPSDLKSVRPYLFNFFMDPAIIRAPHPIRFLVACMISLFRGAKTKAIYEKLGGKSPLLDNTLAQAKLLEKELGSNYKVFTCMRYWHPRAKNVVQDVKKSGAEEIFLLPLYPQFSTTTTDSSIKEWDYYADKAGLKKAKRACCYPLDDTFIDAHVALLKPFIEKHQNAKTKILFSAHGLPQDIIDDGDPYQWQIEQGVKRIMEKLDTNLESIICYQSKVGPKKWLEPSAESIIEQCGKNKENVILVPIAFTAEHSETLVELDDDYKKLAHESGVPLYDRVPALGTHPLYIQTLPTITRQHMEKDKKEKRLCPKEFCACYLNNF